VEQLLPADVPRAVQAEAADVAGRRAVRARGARAAAGGQAGARRGERGHGGERGLGVGAGRLREEGGARAAAAGKEVQERDVTAAGEPQPERPVDAVLHGSEPRAGRARAGGPRCGAAEVGAVTPEGVSELREETGTGLERGAGLKQQARSAGVHRRGDDADGLAWLPRGPGRPAQLR